MPGAATATWSGPTHVVADALGVELIEVEGSSSVTCQIELADEHGDNNGAGIVGSST